MPYVRWDENAEGWRRPSRRIRKAFPTLRKGLAGIYPLAEGKGVCVDAVRSRCGRLGGCAHGCGVARANVVNVGCRRMALGVRAIGRLYAWMRCGEGKHRECGASIYNMESIGRLDGGCGAGAWCAWTDCLPNAVGLYFGRDWLLFRTQSFGISDAVVLGFERARFWETGSLVFMGVMQERSINGGAA